MRPTAVRLLPLLLIVALLGGSDPGQAQIWPDVRLVHAAADVGPVDVYVNGLRILNDMPYGDHTDYLTAPPGPQTIEVFPDGGDEPLLTDQFEINAGRSYTVALYRDGPAEPAMGVWTDEIGQRPQAKSRLRVLHLAPAPEQVSIVRPDGPSPFAPVINGQATAYATLPAGRLRLQVREPGTQEPLLATERTLPARAADSLALIPDPADGTLTALWLHDAGPSSANAD